MKFTNIINSFRSGKVSKKISNRQDVEALKDGCEELTNFILLPNGVLKRRYGTNIIDTHVPLTKGTLYSLKYSQEHSFIVQLVDGLNMDIFAYENREIVMTKGGWSSVPTSTFVRIFSTDGTEYVVQTLLQKSKFYVNSSHDMFSGLESNPCTKYPDDGWTVTQFSRKMIFTHNSGRYAPFVIDLIITEDPDIKFNVMPWFLDFELYNREADTQYDGGDYVALGGITTPFPPMVKQKYTLEIQNPTGTIGTSGKISKDLDARMIKRVIINKSSLGGLTNYSDLVGTGIKVFHTTGNKEGYLLITSVDNVPGSTTIGVTAVCTVEPDNDATTSTYDTWVFSYWGFNNGYPKASTAFRGRVVFGGTRSAPNRFFIAAVNINNTASFQNLQTAKLIQDAGATDFSGMFFYNNTIVTDIAIVAAFNESNAGDIKWIKGRRLLHFGTATGEHQVSFLNNIVAATNMETQKVSSYSSSNISPVEGDQKIIYTANDYTTIRTISTNARDYESTDISLSALYPEVQYIRSIAWAEEASSLLYQTPGKLNGICINEQTQAMGFYDFEFPFIVESFCNLTVSKEEAVLSLGINVTVDKEYTVILANVGASYKMVYLLIDQVDKDFVNGEYHYLDLAKYLSDANPSDPMWAGKTLIVRWDSGAVQTVVADGMGAVTLANPTSAHYLIGVRNTARGVTVPINYGARYGQSVGLIKRVDRAMPLLTKSGRMLLGSNNGTLYVPRKSGTGWFDDYEPVMELSNSPDYSIKCVFESYEDEPLNINGIAYRGVTYEGE